MQSDKISSSANAVGVNVLLRQFDELAEEEKDAFVERLIRRAGIQRVMNLVAICARAEIENIRDR